MDVFGKGTAEPSRPLLPPGECWICEQSPTQSVQRVIDTRRNTRAGGALSHESVRKYVCESCAVEMGAAMGMVPEAQYDEAIAAGRKLEAEVAELQGELALAQNAQTRVVSVDELETALAALKPKPAPRARKTDVPAE
jgi:hypothetical protein